MAAYQNMKPLRALVLLAIGGVLIATLVSFVARWRGAGSETYATQVEPLGGEVDQQTKAFSLSKTDGDHTLYTIKAEQVTTFKETQKALLHGVVVDIFGKADARERAGGRHDRITTPESEYDPVAQTLWVPGDVEMNFALPASATGPSANPSDAANADTAADTPDITAGGAPESRVVIHTSQLRFDQSTGVATTDAPVRFSFPQGEGSSRGARYDPQQQSLHLLAAVEFRLREKPETPEKPGEAGEGDSAPTTIRAGELTYLRAESRIALGGTVEIVKQTRRVRAHSGSVWLDDQNQVQRAELTGDVQAQENSPGMMANARAGRALLDFSQTGAIRTVDLLEAVSWSAGGSGAKGDPVALAGPEREGSSRRMALTFTPPAGVGGRASTLDRATATENVKITLRGGRGTASSANSSVAGNTTAGQMQVLTGQEAELFFAPTEAADTAGQGSATLRDAKLRGAPKMEMHGEAGAAPRTITANGFDFDFSPAGELAQFTAAENVRVVSPVSAIGTRKTDTRITTSKHLEARFEPASGKMLSLRQTENFTYADSARQATAASALYQAGTELLTLERALPGSRGDRKPAQPAIVLSNGQPGSPDVAQGGGRIAADVIRLATASGDLEATGAVATTSTSAGGVNPATSREPVHATADKLIYTEATQTARYSGRARLWQGTGFLLEAESAILDRRKSLLTATGKVLTIFRPAPRPAPAGSAARSAGSSSSTSVAAKTEPAGAYVVRAENVSYSQREGIIAYEGKVQATQDGGKLTSETLEISLRGAENSAPSELESTASRIEKMVARGGVQLSETGRIGKGDTVEYFAESKKVNLHGKPATLSDSQRGSTKGVQLSYQIGDNSASVVGDGGEQTETRWVPAK